MEKLLKKRENKGYLIRILFIITLMAISTHAFSDEMIIGKEKIPPGINLIFEGAIKDHIEPKEFYLQEKDSDIHIEALVTWSSDGPEKGDVGFHYDWREKVNKNLISKKIFTYKNQNFEGQASLTRR